MPLWRGNFPSVPTSKSSSTRTSCLVRTFSLEIFQEGGSTATDGLTYPASNVAPALQAAQKELQRSRLEVCSYNAEVLLVPLIDSCGPLPKDALDAKLKSRPPAEQLVKEGILQSEYTAIYPVSHQKSVRVVLTRVLRQRQRMKCHHRDCTLRTLKERYITRGNRNEQFINLCCRQILACPA